MKRTTTLTLLALTCLTAIPSIVHARYRDGMNLYEYVRSEPVSGRDPTGLWKLDRDKTQSRAVATAEKGDTVSKLAFDIRLEPDEYYLWMKLTVKTYVPFGSGVISNKLRTVKGHFSTAEIKAKNSEFTIKTEICEGEKVSIPNDVLIIWGVGRLADLNPLAGFNAMYWGAHQAGVRADADGFRVLNLERPTWLRAVTALKSPDLDSMVFAGHGTENGGGLVLSDDESPIVARHEGWSVPETLHGSTNNYLEPGPYVHHRLARMLLLACRSLSPASDQGDFRPSSVAGSRKETISGWEVNVSSEGVLGGFIGDVDHTNVYPRCWVNGYTTLADLWRLRSGGAEYTSDAREKRENDISKRSRREQTNANKRKSAAREGRIVPRYSPIVNKYNIPY